MRALLGILMLMVQAPAWSESCSQEWVCVEPEDDGHEVRFYARNLKPWPLTLTIEIRTRHLSPTGRSTITRTLPGDERVLLKSLSVTDAGKYDYSYSFDWTVGSQNPDHDEDHPYQLPYASGQAYRVLQGFGSRFSHRGLEHYAVDFDMPAGSPVHAARSGVIVRVVQHNDRGCWQKGCGRFANYIIVLHDDATTGEYYHLQHRGSLVEEGQRVQAGQHIGLSGNTGHTTMPHLHFAVYRADRWGRTQSLPFRFRSAEGLIRRPRAGRRYSAE